MKNLITRAQTAFMMYRVGVKPERTEKGDHLLEVLGTIIIAVVILILFKGVIVNIFTNALNKTSGSVDGLFGNVTTNTTGG